MQIPLYIDKIIDSITIFFFFLILLAKVVDILNQYLFCLQRLLMYVFFSSSVFLVPQFHEKIGETSIVGFHKIDTVQTDATTKTQQVHAKVVETTVDSFLDIINNTRLEAGVAVDQQQNG